MEKTAEWKVRSFRPEDLPACRRLYHEGLLGGELAANDTGLDLDDIPSNYLNKPGNHFWVAENEAGEVVGMVGVQHWEEESAGQVRRLRVARDHRRRGVGSALVETALQFCNENQYLKITLESYMDREPALKIFDKFRFRHERSRMVGTKELLYFYRDLYVGSPRALKGDELHSGPAGTGN
jgi:ribosomal protein S18 acetylase RimI-like enzyme